MNSISGYPQFIALISDYLSHQRSDLSLSSTSSSVDKNDERENEQHKAEDEEVEEGDEEWEEGDPILHPDRVIIEPRHPLPEGQKPFKAYMYILVVAGVLVYVGQTNNKLTRQGHHALKLCREEKFDMIIIAVVQSATKDGAVFGAGRQEQLLLARLTEQGVRLRGREQTWYEKNVTSGRKDPKGHYKGRPIMEDGMMTIPPAHNVEKVRMFCLPYTNRFFGFQDQPVYSAFVYTISLNEKPVYIGSSIRYGDRRRHNACNLFKEEKDDFVMIILYEVQSLKPAAAVFLA